MQQGTCKSHTPHLATRKSSLLPAVRRLHLESLHAHTHCCSHPHLSLPAATNSPHLSHVVHTQPHLQPWMGTFTWHYVSNQDIYGPWTTLITYYSCLPFTMPPHGPVFRAHLSPFMPGHPLPLPPPVTQAPRLACCRDRQVQLAPGEHPSSLSQALPDPGRLCRINQTQAAPKGAASSPQTLQAGALG